MRRCKKCSAPRKDKICWKCGTPTFQPAKGWKEPVCPSTNKIREIAREVGYAIGEHGSRERDLDLIAAPWTEDAIGNAALIEHIASELGAEIMGIERKPHGRYGATLQMNGYFKPIDISVCPRCKDDRQPQP